MVDLHDLFSSLLFIGIMGFILNFGVEMVIEVLLGMKCIEHIKRRRKSHLYARLPCQSSSDEHAFKILHFFRTCA